MRRTVHTWFDGGPAVAVGMASSLLLGLFFVFVWAPHPWGWHGIDQYHALALQLARGGRYETTDVPWGYPYFLAFFYRLAGDRPWLPLTAQVALNALVPLLTWHLVKELLDRRTAAVAALLTGALSFNTVYASTQASDAVCTVIFLFGILCLARIERGRHQAVVSGLALGLAAQFRPNLIAFPLVAAALLVWRSPQRWVSAAIMFTISTAVDVPWIVRNYRLTGDFIPTSTHGSIQLWYGSLQVGPYLTDRTRNPASAFEPPAFDYSSLAATPIQLTGHARGCAPPGDDGAHVVFWTDREPSRRHLSGIQTAPQYFRFELPGQPLDTAIYYYFEVARGADVERTPHGGADEPLVFFVSGNHLWDMDRHGDLLDAFDVARLLRHVAWSEPLRFAARLDMDGNGGIDQVDLERAVTALTMDTAESSRSATVHAFADRAVATLGDGSRFEVPRTWSGRITDITVSGGLAEKLAYAHRTFSSLRPQVPPESVACLQFEDLRRDDPFYRREPDQMRRYSALAFDNIRHHPMAFAAASAFRMGRLFVVTPSGPRSTIYRFRGSRFVYAAAMVMSTLYLVFFVLGLAMAVRERRAPALLVAPVLYIPVTLCYVLTNMRYVGTVQPFVFAFIAVAIVALIDAGAARESTCPTP